MNDPNEAMVDGATPLRDRISFLVHRINANLARATNPRLKEWGLDLSESRLMVALLEGGPMPVGDIVQTMALPQSTISHQLKRLEHVGYLTRESGARDSRVIIVSLTEHGRKVALEANEHSSAVTNRIAEAIGQDEIEIVRAAMKRADEAIQLL